MCGSWSASPFFELTTSLVFWVVEVVVVLLWNKALLKLRRFGGIEWLVLVLVLRSLLMEKNKLIREKTRMTHKKKIATLAQESLLSLVLSLSLKPIIAVAVDVSLTHTSFQRTPSTRSPWKCTKKKLSPWPVAQCVWKTTQSSGFWMIRRGEKYEKRW